MCIDSLVRATFRRFKSFRKSPSWLAFSCSRTREIRRLERPHREKALCACERERAGESSRYKPPLPTSRPCGFQGQPCEQLGNKESSDRIFSATNQAQHFNRLAHRLHSNIYCEIEFG